MNENLETISSRKPIKESEWLMDRSPKGQCYTLQYQKPLQTTDTIIFGLFPEASSYVVVLHDPKFFLKTETPLIFPRILNEYKVRF